MELPHSALSFNTSTQLCVALLWKGRCFGEVIESMLKVLGTISLSLRGQYLNRCQLSAGVKHSQHLVLWGRKKTNIKVTFKTKHTL